MSLGILHPNSISNVMPKPIGSTVYYRGKRCKLFAYQPAYTRLKDCWPVGVSYEGLTLNSHGSLKEILESCIQFERFVLVYKQVGLSGLEVSPRYFFVRAKHLGGIL